MCRQPTMRAPLSGFFLPYSPRSAISPGISVSAMAISLRPQSAREISATLQSVKAGITGFLKAGGERAARGRDKAPRAAYSSAVEMGQDGETWGRGAAGARSEGPTFEVLVFGEILRE